MKKMLLTPNSLKSKISIPLYKDITKFLSELPSEKVYEDIFNKFAKIKKELYCDILSYKVNLGLPLF